MTGRSADLPCDGRGRQYHIGLGPGELAGRVLLAGDPGRVDRAERLLDEVEHRTQCREFRTVTGRRRGMRLSVMSTGIGCDNTEIAVVELCQLVEDPVVIRVGSCGALRPGIGTGDLVISTGAVRMESTSTFFVPEGYPAVSHYEVTAALVRAAEEAGACWHAGLTATAPGFYGAQGRRVPGFPPRRPETLEELAGLGVLNFEMEASTLFTLASVRGFRAGCVCAVFANRPRGAFIADEDKEAAEASALLVGCEALAKLAGEEEA